MTEGKPAAEVNPSEPSSSTQPSSPSESTKPEPTGSEISTTPVPDRSELLSRARGFLQSPQIMHQDAVAKRQFLLEKGLNESEITGLLRQVPIQRPAIPPRAYPQLPPSNLPTLLLGLSRVFSWIVGGSTALIFIYYRFFLPRIIKSSLARQSLKAHHLSLLRKLNESLASLRKSQIETNSVLPLPDPSQEAPNFQACHRIADILKLLDPKDPDVHSIPPITLLRCSLQGFSKGKESEMSQPTTEELFRYMEGQIPWLVSEEGLRYEDLLWQTLSTSPLFTGTTPESEINEEQRPTRWTYNTPSSVEPSPVVKSLKKLTISLPKNSEPKNNSSQHTLQALSDFTGYISTQMYMPYQAPTSAAGFLSGNSSLGPAEEEFRREIRALKGLVLNRRSFMPAIPRPPISTP
ncbi:hypothetical protein H2248_006591 [Termitomyces sp. 'cryptogamus']|nr:hypothetical protein H2248_006591 [Termitomyces sp. 'cryptogamus']